MNRPVGTTDRVAAIARSVLYEGYLLWPYRRSALKNQRRWTFGGVFPRSYSESGHLDDAWSMRTECLAEVRGEAELDVSIRFLQVVDRRVARLDSGEEQHVDSLTVAGTRYVAWQEAVEREVTLRSIRMSAARNHLALRTPIAIASGEHREQLLDEHGRIAGVIVRRWDALAGAVDVTCEVLSSGLRKLCVVIANESPWTGGSRERALERTFVSTHTMLRVRNADFVSLTDPPINHATAAATCRNFGTWPVLVGEPPARDTLLSSPIILSDYPEVAPESGGDFFDGAEIDQLLVLSVLSMTAEEQQWMRETDARAGEILDRCLSASAGELARLHGVTRIGAAEAP